MIKCHGVIENTTTMDQYSDRENATMIERHGVSENATKIRVSRC